MLRRCGERLAGWQRIGGITLVELMVTIAVLAVVLVMAMPSFTALVNRNRLTGQANEIVASLQLARSEALHRNARMRVCRTTDGATCAGADGAWAQWLTLDGSGAILRHDVAGSTLRVTAGVHEIVFRGDGMAIDSDGALLTTALNVCMQTLRPADNQRVVSLNLGGRTSVAAVNGGGACPV